MQKILKPGQKNGQNSSKKVNLYVKYVYVSFIDVFLCVNNAHNLTYICKDNLNVYCHKHKVYSMVRAYRY